MAALLVDFEQEMATAETATTTVRRNGSGGGDWLRKKASSWLRVEGGYGPDEDFSS
ncbi:hypothetical protein OROMI_013637 [Orobanche minor]